MKGLPLRLFESQKKKSEVKYVGEFVLDTPAFHLAKAPDRNGDVRNVLVFHLQPVGVPDLPAIVGVGVQEGFELGPSESGQVTEFVRQAQPKDSVSVRREIQPQQEFEAWLTGRGVKVGAARTSVRDATSPLKPDLVLPDLRLVIEAKASTARGHVRTAVGQVLDYRFNLTRLSDGQPWSAAILLPGPVGESVWPLLEDIGIGVIYPDGDGFAALGMNLPG